MTCRLWNKGVDWFVLNLFVFKIDEIIKLNMGWYNFVTSKNIFDNCWLSHNFLTAMFTGVWKRNKDDNDNYFIDRDGLYFNHILIKKSK